MRAGIPICDLLAGYFAAIGILTALLESEVSGRGQQVQTSLLEAMTASLSFQAAKFANTGETPPPVGNHHPLTSPMGVYRASDGYFNLAAGNDSMLTRLAEAIGRPDLAQIRDSPEVSRAFEIGATSMPILDEVFIATDGRRVGRSAERCRRRLRSDLQARSGLRRSAGSACRTAAGSRQ